MNNTHFLNGAFVSEAQLVISPRDIGFSRGYAVFDFLKTYPHHRPFKLTEHIDRLFHSAHLIGLSLPWSKEQVRAWVLETLAANDTPEEKFIKIFVSGGVASAMLPSTHPTIAIVIDPAVPCPQKWYEKGIGVMTVKHTRYNPAAKSANYIEGVLRMQQAQTIGAVEPLYYDDAQVLEGATSNIFAVIDGMLVTPKTNILPGITRNVLLEIVTLPIPLAAKDFTLAALLRAEEAFFTGSGKEIRPITSLDGTPLGNGAVGPVTKEVMRQFRNYTRSDLW